MGWSPTGPEAGGSLVPTRPALIELRGGFVRVCRTGCDLRCDEASAGAGLADFIVKIVSWEGWSQRAAKQERERERGRRGARDRARGGRGKTRARKAARRSCRDKITLNRKSPRPWRARRVLQQPDRVVVVVAGARELGECDDGRGRSSLAKFGGRRSDEERWLGGSGFVGGSRSKGTLWVRLIITGARAGEDAARYRGGTPTRAQPIPASRKPGPALSRGDTAKADLGRVAGGQRSPRLLLVGERL